MSLRDNNKRDEGTNICSLNIFLKQKKNSQFPRPRPKLSLLNFLFFLSLLAVGTKEENMTNE
jgi:hypothetical protein